MCILTFVLLSVIAALLYDLWRTQKKTPYRDISEVLRHSKYGYGVFERPSPYRRTPYRDISEVLRHGDEVLETSVGPSFYEPYPVKYEPLRIPRNNQSFGTMYCSENLCPKVSDCGCPKKRSANLDESS